MKFRYPRRYSKYQSKNIIEEWKEIEIIFNEIEKKFSVNSARNPQINKFEIFSSKINPIYFRSWFIEYSLFRFKLCLIEYTTEYYHANTMLGQSKSSIAHKYFFGHLKLMKDFGKTYIRHESVLDKISELFNPIEIDFKKHKKFSRKYYVLSNNSDLVKNNFSIELLDFLSSTSNLEIEFDRKSCLFRLPKAMNMKEVLELCSIGLNLDKYINF